MYCQRTIVRNSLWERGRHNPLVCLPGWLQCRRSLLCVGYIIIYVLSKYEYVLYTIGWGFLRLLHRCILSVWLTDLSTGWGGHLFWRFCLLFLEFPRLSAVLQLPCCPSKQWELWTFRKHITKPSEQVAAPPSSWDIQSLIRGENAKIPEERLVPVFCIFFLHISSHHVSPAAETHGDMANIHSLELKFRVAIQYVFWPPKSCPKSSH